MVSLPSGLLAPCALANQRTTSAARFGWVASAASNGLPALQVLMSFVSPVYSGLSAAKAGAPVVLVCELVMRLSLQGTVHNAEMGPDQVFEALFRAVSLGAVMSPATQLQLRFQYRAVPLVSRRARDVESHASGCRFAGQLLYNLFLLLLCFFLYQCI